MLVRLARGVTIQSTSEGLNVVGFGGTRIPLNFVDLVLISRLQEQGTPVTVEELATLSSTAPEVALEAARRLVAANIATDMAEELDTVDSAWAPLTMQYHSACEETEFLDYSRPDGVIADRQVMEEAYAEEAQPLPQLSYFGAGHGVKLPEAGGSLGHFLAATGKTRQPASEPFHEGTVARLLSATAGPLDSNINAFGLSRLRRTVPSGGNNHPTNVYVISDVFSETLSCHYYNPVHNSLNLLAENLDMDVLLSSTLVMTHRLDFDCKVILLYTWTPTRAMFRYRDARTYRVLGFDLGHLMRNAQSVARSLGWACHQAYEPISSRLRGLTANPDQLIEPIVGASIIGTQE